MPPFDHKDICRLDVAADDARGMGGIERVGYLQNVSKVWISSGLSAILCLSVCPSRSSMAMKVRPSASSIS